MSNVFFTSRVGVEWINDFHDNDCKQCDLSYCDDQVNGFYNHMGKHGHVKVFNFGNESAWESDFRHPDFGGDSLNWSDDVHFCMVNDHGGNVNNVVRFSFSVKHKHCSVPSTKMQLGRKNLRWLAALGCDAVLNTHADHICAVWSKPMKGVHIVCGYIGLAADSLYTTRLGQDFADDICDGDSIAGSWVARAYSAFTGDESIAIAAGSTREEAIARRDRETLNWRDDVLTRTSWLAWKYRK